MIKMTAEEILIEIISFHTSISSIAFVGNLLIIKIKLKNAEIFTTIFSMFIIPYLTKHNPV